MLPLLKRAAEGETRVPDVSIKIAEDLGLTPDEQEQRLPSGQQTILHNRIHWAKYYMTKAGLINVPRRGRFLASAEGRALLAQNPEKIDNTILLQYPSFREFYRGNADAADAGKSRESVEPAADSAATPEEQIETAHIALMAVLRAQLLERIWQNSPAFFEQLIVDLLVAMGYGGSHRDAAQHLGRSGDGGVDGVINEDRLGLDRVYVQAKRYAEAISVQRAEVQGFVGSLLGQGANKGVFATTSSFARGARDYAKGLRERVILIDGQQLADLMIEHNVGVRTSRALEFKRLDEDFFAEEE
jgi:restriction system protein